jgi:hypothetical protein
VRSLIDQIGEEKVVEILENNLPAKDNVAQPGTSQEAQDETQRKLNSLKHQIQIKSKEV